MSTRHNIFTFQYLAFHIFSLMLFQLTEQRDKHNKAEYAYESDYTQTHRHIKIKSCLSISMFERYSSKLFYFASRLNSNLQTLVSVTQIQWAHFLTKYVLLVSKT